MLKKRYKNNSKLQSSNLYRIFDPAQLKCRKFHGYSAFNNVFVVQSIDL